MAMRLAFNKPDNLHRIRQAEAALSFHERVKFSNYLLAAMTVYMDAETMDHCIAYSLELAKAGFSARTVGGVQ